MNLLILDVESSSLDPSTGQVLEVGTAVYSVEHRSLIRARSWLVAAESNAAESVNGIPPALLANGVDFDVVQNNVYAIAIKECSHVVAHGASFDRKWFRPDIQRLPWVCSMREMDWKRKPTSKSLVALALAYGVGVSAAHRALDDVMTLARTFERAAELGEDVAALITRASRPKVRVVSLASFEEKEIVKAAGFYWDSARKEWWREMPAEELASLSFPYRTESIEASR